MALEPEPRSPSKKLERKKKKLRTKSNSYVSGL